MNIICPKNTGPRVANQQASEHFSLIITLVEMRGQNREPSTVGPRFSVNKFFRILTTTKLGILKFPKAAIAAFFPI